MKLNLGVLCTMQSKNRTKRLITINCQPRSLIQKTAFRHNRYDERIRVEFNEWNATTLLLLLYLESLPTWNLLLNFLFSVFNVFGARTQANSHSSSQQICVVFLLCQSAWVWSCCFGPGTRCSIQFNLRCRPAINTFKDKLSINFQCLKIINSFIFHSPSTAVVNFESDDSETRRIKNCVSVCIIGSDFGSRERKREREN